MHQELHTIADMGKVLTVSAMKARADAKIQHKSDEAAKVLAAAKIIQGQQQVQVAEEAELEEEPNTRRRRFLSAGATDRVASPMSPAAPPLPPGKAFAPKGTPKMFAKAGATRTTQSAINPVTAKVPGSQVRSKPPQPSPPPKRSRATSPALSASSGPASERKPTVPRSRVPSTGLINVDALPNLGTQQGGGKRYVRKDDLDPIAVLKGRKLGNQLHGVLS